MRPECERYEALIDAAGTGGLRSPADQAFVEEHPRSCRECEALERGLSAIAMAEGAPGHFPLDDLAARRLVNSVLSAADEEEAAPSRRFRPVLVAAAALVLLLGGGLALWSRTPEAQPVAGATQPPGAPQPDEPEPTEVAVGAPVEAQLRVAGGEKVAPGGHSVGAGGTVAAKEARTYSVGAFVWFRVVGGEARLLTLREREVRIELVRGRVDVQVTPEQGVRLEVATPAATVRVVGTRFSVARSAASTRVVVQHGRVEVRTDSGVVAVSAGERLDVGGAVSPASAEELAELTELTELAAGVERAAEPGAGAGSEEQGVQRTLKPEGKRGPRREPPGGAARPAGATSSTSGDRPGGSLPSAPVVGAPQESAATLLERAQQARARREWHVARRAYEAIVDGLPSSAAAGAALVSLGQLEIDQLGRPRDGLARCDAYVAQYRAGPLRSEAELCRIRAFRALGDVTAEASAIDAFLAMFPDDFNVGKLKARRTTLAPPGH